MDVLAVFLCGAEPACTISKAVDAYLYFCYKPPELDRSTDNWRGDKRQALLGFRMTEYGRRGSDMVSPFPC
jgi:hypothetical protein